MAARIRELIQDSAGDAGGGELTADDLAAAAGCSRYAAYRAFRQAYGLAPSDYQRQLRVRTARRLLIGGRRARPRSRPTPASPTRPT